VIPSPVSDLDYVAYHAVLRLALPETKLIITRRETLEMIDMLRPMINIEDLAPRPGVGGNYKCRNQTDFHETHFQNQLGDARTAEEIVKDIRQKGYNALVKGI